MEGLVVDDDIVGLVALFIVFWVGAPVCLLFVEEEVL